MIKEQNFEYDWTNDVNAPSAVIQITHGTRTRTPSPIKWNIFDSMTLDEKRLSALKMQRNKLSPVLRMIKKINDKSQNIKHEVLRPMRTQETKFCFTDKKQQNQKSEKSLERLKNQRIPTNASLNTAFNLEREMKMMVTNIRQSKINSIDRTEILNSSRLQHSQSFFNHLVKLRKSPPQSRSKSRNKSTTILPKNNIQLQDQNQSRIKSQNKSTTILPKNNIELQDQNHKQCYKLANLFDDSKKITQDFLKQATQLKKIVSQIKHVPQKTNVSDRESKQIIEMIEEEPKMQYNYRITKTFMANNKLIRAARIKLYSLGKDQNQVLQQKIKN